MIELAKNMVFTDTVGSRLCYKEKARRRITNEWNVFETGKI
jgi:hypothetical protein